MNVRSRGIIRTILLGGIIAGTIDIGAACLINGRSIPFILQTIAGGVLARQSYAGGVRAEPIPWNGRPWSVKLRVPPLAAVYFKPQRD